MWDKIVELAPGLEQNLKFIMSDYERAAMSTINRRFPTASLHGCWFHYSQSLYRKWRRLQLNSAPREVLFMAISMALAPSNLFHESVNIMQTIADNVSTTHPNILLFMAYLRTTWLPIASKVSVFKCPLRTNNLVESFHHVATQKIGTHCPSLWIFLDYLVELISNQELDYHRLENNVRPRRPSSRFNNQRNAQIVEGQNSLMNGSISLKQFLHMFYRSVQQYEQPGMLEDIDNDDEIDGSLLSDETFNMTLQNQQSIQRTHNRRNHNRLQTRTVSQRENYQFIESTVQENAEIENNNNTRNSEIERSNGTNNRNSEIEENDINRNSEIEENNDTNRNSEIEENNDTNDRNLEIEENNAEDVIYDDDEIYRIPEDDYGLLEESVTLERTFHEIHDIQEIVENNKEPRRDGYCIICINEKSCIVFTPCGHVCVCATCNDNLVHKKCPLCNLTYDNYIKMIVL